MKLFRLTMIVCAIGLLAFTQGCATGHQAIATARTALNQGLDTLDKALTTVDKIKGEAVSGTKETVHTATQ